MYIYIYIYGSIWVSKKAPPCLGEIPITKDCCASGSGSILGGPYFRDATYQVAFGHDA